MRTFRRNSPSLNAGSMADIAFLLLIFFLVTTTISADKGILRQLPELCPPEEVCSEILEEQNVLNIIINVSNDIMVEGEQIDISELKTITKDFIDNNGDGSCAYCSGKGLSTASDRPTKAAISLTHDPQSKYSTFIAVQDQLTMAFYELRETYAKQEFNKTPEMLTKAEQQKLIKVYPFKLTEINNRSSN